MQYTRIIVQYAVRKAARYAALLLTAGIAGPVAAQPSSQPSSAQSPVPLPTFCVHVPPASQTLPGASSFTYRTPGERALRIHVFAAGGQTRQHPAALFFFGGGFRVGDAASFSELAKIFAAHGYVAVVADYHILCRDNATAVAGVEDAQAALAWLRRHAGQFGIDRGKIVLAGGSAGGLLAAATALRVRAAQRPAALVLFNPVLDLEAGVWAHDQSAQQALVYSPSRLPVAGLPPTIIFHGVADHTVPIVSSRTFCARAIAARRTCQLVEYPGMDHSFADKHERDPALGVSPFADTTNRAFQFLSPVIGLPGNTTAAP